jgi:tetratricopeptide (TPR) repeat protein
MSRLASTFVAASVALAPLPAFARLGPSSEAARAGDPDAIAEGEARRQEAITAFNAGDLGVAVEKFKEAYAADPSPAYLFNIGRVYEEMGQLEDALEYYERFARQPHLKLEERQQAGERIEILRKLVQPKTAGDDSTVKADDPEDGASGGTNNGGTTREPVDASSVGRPLVIAGAALLSVGGAIAIGGGLGLGLAARNRSARIDAIQPGENPDMLSLTEAEDLDAEGRTLELWQIVTAAAGGAIAITGAALLGVGLSRRAKAKVQRSASVSPVASRDFAGFVVRGRF